MTPLSRTGAWVAAALVVAPFGHAWTWSSQSPPVPAQAETQVASTPPQQPERQPRESRRRGRTGRPPRTSAPRRSTEVVLETPGAGRTSRDPGPVRQELTLEVNLLGGYDDDVTSMFRTDGGSSPVMAGGSLGYLDARLDYRRGDRRRWIVLESQGNVLAYPDYLPRPAAGGEATIGAKTTAGRALGLGASGQLRYEPFFSPFSPAAGTEPLLPGLGESSPTTLYEHRSLRFYASAFADRPWGQDDRTRLSFSRGRRQFDYHRGDNDWLEVVAEHGRTLADGVGALVKYRLVNTGYLGSDGVERSFREHALTAGAEIERPISRRRLLVLAVRGGAGTIESSGSVGGGRNNRSWVPVGQGSAALSISPSWVVESGYQRAFQLLHGLTDEVYTTDSAFLAASGQLFGRTDLHAKVTYGDWKTSLARGADDRLRVYAASLQVNVRLTPKVVGTAGYSYYHHNYSNPSALPAGFPPAYDRHAVRVGLSISVPLVGASVPSPLMPR